MATTHPKKRIKKEDPEEEKQLILNPGTRRGIIIVTIFVVAVISILSFFDLAGSVGNFLDQVLMVVFGWGSFLFPLILLVVGYLLIFPDKYSLGPSNYLGVFLFVLALSGIFHLFVLQEEAVLAISEGRGGGYLGLIISLPLLKIMGIWATTIVLVALLCIAILVVFATSINRLIEGGGAVGSVMLRIRDFFRRIKYRLASRREDKENEEDDDVSRSFSKKRISQETEPEEAETDGDSTEANEDVESGNQMKFFNKGKHKTKIDIPIDLLEGSSSKPTSGDMVLNKEKIQKTLENFGIDVEMGETNVGPTVTQYTLKPAEGVRISQIDTLQNDIALALAAHPIRIEAPIPGKSLVGIEVPNQKVAVVKLKEVIQSESFKKGESNLNISLGKDVSGNPWIADLDSMPHLLVAGATGSGKSVCINSIIISLLYQNSPDDLKFILVDPKQVELTIYNGIPHLLTPVITKADKTINALKWTVGEMDRRFELLSHSGKKNIKAFNGELKESLPYIVVVIDELADLMSVAPAEVEGSIIRLAQMARAVGIHLVVATQRPSVDVITGLIKANITSRIAFTVASGTDSRTILDFAGAEKLLGNGDMLYVSAQLSKPKRLQGAFVTEREIRNIVDFLVEKGEPEYNDDVTTRQASHVGERAESFSDEDDELIDDAQEIIMEAQKASASFLQRRLRIGYARAARILDILEEKGIIGPADGAKPREVFVKDKEDVDMLSDKYDEEDKLGEEEIEEDKDSGEEV
ncbi:DNA translocase FtsK [Patescibacteria group bacterium]|nr:DNA translocase FtsK [Patescibacteria group bacterium]MBU1951655.1 DNA translocase FtsK [Patescibacteria group bacterium]